MVKGLDKREELLLVSGCARFPLPAAQRLAELSLSRLLRPRSLRELIPCRRFKSRLA